VPHCLQNAPVTEAPQLVQKAINPPFASLLYCKPRNFAIRPRRPPRFVREWKALEFLQDHPRGRRAERRVVSDEAETPFDSIEGSHEYVAMLAEALDEARRDVEAEIAAAEREGAIRRKEALLLVSYNLAKLNLHITSSRRILNDLRSLRRLLLAERGLPVEGEKAESAESA